MARHARRLSKLTSFPLMIGQVVHDVLRDLALEVVAGRPTPDFEVLWTPAWERVIAVRKTTREEFERDPAKHPMLTAAYYGSLSQREIGDALREAGDVLEQCLASALDLPLWDDLRTAVTVRAPDKAVHRKIHVLGDPYPCTWWGAPDLAYIRSGRAGIDVVDYKTGASLDTEEGDAQIHGYAAFMVACGVQWTPTWRGRLINMRDGLESEVPITREGIHRAFARIETDVRRWRRCQADPARNTATMETFPLTADRGLCYSCAFAELCESTRGPAEVPGAPTPGGSSSEVDFGDPDARAERPTSTVSPIRVPAIPAPRRGQSG